MHRVHTSSYYARLPSFGTLEIHRSRERTRERWIVVQLIGKLALCH
jgi:hypothetical protein